MLTGKDWEEADIRIGLSVWQIELGFVEQLFSFQFDMTFGYYDRSLQITDCRLNDTKLNNQAHQWWVIIQIYFKTGKELDE